MSQPLAFALKEWAVICRALTLGQQSLLLRKGGIAEPGGSFRLEATRFWLYPTFVHQQEVGIRPEALPLLEEVTRDRPTAGRVRLDAWAEVTGIYEVRDLLPAHLLAHLHFWSDDAVEKRFHYRTPGLSVLTVRVWRAPHPHEIEDLPEYQGCKSWVPLREPVDAANSIPVLSDSAHHDAITQIETLLRPIARV